MEDSVMENVFPLESLPVTVIEIVAKNLSPRDLAACCATSHGMRELFDQGFIWKEKCDQGLAEYLRNTPCKVQPAFQSPESENSTLPPISYWRKAYMAENHLWNNWRLGKFTEEVIKMQNSDSEHYKCLFHMFHSSDIVIAKFSDKIKLLDVKARPIVDVIDPIVIPSYPEYILHPFGDRLVIVNNSCVKVYHLDFLIKKGELEHMFIVNEQERVSPIRLRELNSRFCESISMMYVVTDSLLVGIPCKQSTMHIWNLKTGIKLKEQACPLKVFQIATITATNCSSTLLMTFRNNRDGSEKFLAYSLLTLSYLPFSENYKGSRHHVLGNKHVAVWGVDGIIRVYDFLKSESNMLLEYQMPFPTIILGSSFYHPLGIFGVDRTKLVIFNPVSQSLSTLITEIRRFMVLSNRFIQVEMLSGRLEILEIDRNYSLIFRKTFMNLNFSVCAFFLNKASTRYIVRRDVGKLINFW